MEYSCTQIRGPLKQQLQFLLLALFCASHYSHQVTQKYILCFYFSFLRLSLSTACTCYETLSNVHLLSSTNTATAILNGT